jgi:hypothetical protein
VALLAKNIRKKRNAREVILLLGALLMLILLFYLCIDIHWLFMLLSAIVHLAHNMRMRFKFKQFQHAAPCDSQGRRHAKKPKVNLSQTSWCSVGRVSGRQLPFLFENTLDSKLMHGANLNLDETDCWTCIGLKKWW